MILLDALSSAQSLSWQLKISVFPSPVRYLSGVPKLDTDIVFAAVFFSTFIHRTRSGFGTLVTGVISHVAITPWLLTAKSMSNPGTKGATEVESIVF